MRFVSARLRIVRGWCQSVGTRSGRPFGSPQGCRFWPLEPRKPAPDTPEPNAQTGTKTHLGRCVRLVTTSGIGRKRLVCFPLLNRKRGHSLRLTRAPRNDPDLTFGRSASGHPTPRTGPPELAQHPEKVNNRPESSSSVVFSLPCTTSAAARPGTPPLIRHRPAEARDSVPRRSCRRLPARARPRPRRAREPEPTRRCRSGPRAETARRRAPAPTIPPSKASLASTSLSGWTSSGEPARP